MVECDRLVLDMEGEKVNCVQREGMTSLLTSSRVGWEVLVAWLIEQGDPMILSCDIQRATDVAVSHGSLCHADVH